METSRFRILVFFFFSTLTCVKFVFQIWFCLYILVLGFVGEAISRYLEIQIKLKENVKNL